MLKKAHDLLLKGKLSCMSELAAIRADMDHMESDLDHVKASRASGMIEGEVEAKERAGRFQLHG